MSDTYMGMFGATKKGEYYRTIEMLVDKLGCTEKQVMEALYFLYDSQYDNKDLKNMAELILNKSKR